MTDNSPTYHFPAFAKDTIVICGGYGSGKSEVSVNLAMMLARTDTRPVLIADLDIINPYFRSREAVKELANIGVQSLLPPGDQVYADLPIVIPQIKGAIEDHEGKLILDVGGDDQGARVLSSLADAFAPGSYELLLVLNGNRPFTADVAGARKMMNEIEAASRLKFTGIIANTHLIEHTTVETVMDGLKLARDVSKATRLPVAFVSATRNVMEKLDLRQINVPMLPLDRSLLKPWEKKV